MFFFYFCCWRYAIAAAAAAAAIGDGNVVVVICFAVLLQILCNTNKKCVQMRHIRIKGSYQWKSCFVEPLFGLIISRVL